MNKVLLFLFLSCALWAQESSFNSSLLNSQIITEDLIKSSGITKISEIVYLAEKWNFTTLDGSTLFISANNLTPFQRQNVNTFIDGQEVDIEIFDVQDLDLLPVSIDQVDYAELINIPGIYNGYYTKNGAIHIHTKKPSNGLSIQGQHTIGDETGDPGPLAFTDYSSPNVDKLAQFFSVNVNAAGSKWFIRSSIKHEENFKTDPAINRRISYLNSDDNKSALIGYFFRLSAEMFNGTQQFIAGLTTNSDFFYFKPFGNEIPVKQEVRHFGFNGGVGLGKFGINYSAKLSLNQLGYLNNNHNINFDYGFNNQAFNLEVYYNGIGIKGKFGYLYDRYNAVTSQNLTDKNLAFGNFYFQADVSAVKNLSQSAGVYFTKNYGETAAKGFLSSILKLDQRSSLSAAFSYSEELFPEDNNFWVWQQRGYKINLPAEYNFEGELKTRSTFTADASYMYSKDTLYQFEIGGAFRSFSDFYIEEQFFQYSPDSSIFTSVTNLNTNQDLKTAEAFAGFSYRFNKYISARIYYSYGKSISGSETLTEEWKVFPEHKIMFYLNYQPIQNLGVSARVKYFSDAFWYDYKYVSKQSSGNYDMKVNPALLMDLSVNSYLWSRRIWLSGTIRNLFNNPEKYHPAGADLDLRIFLQIHFYFHSIVE